MIYTGDQQPDLVEGESPKLLERTAIQVIPDGRTLHRASRVNFAKPLTLEHNKDVLPVGRVADHHLNVLFEIYSEVSQVSPDEFNNERRLGQFSKTYTSQSFLANSEPPVVR